MAKRTKGAPLTEAFIRRAGVGIHGDGRGSRGLSLRVHRTANGRLSHSWRQAVVLDGKRTALGLGKWPEVPLKEARVNAMGNAVTIARGGDPRRAPLAKTAKAKTFADAAESLIPFAARWMAVPPRCGRGLLRYANTPCRNLEKKRWTRSRCGTPSAYSNRFGRPRQRREGRCVRGAPP